LRGIILGAQGEGKRHRFPPDIISYAVWLYYRFNLSHRDIEDLLAERGITVSREEIRRWCTKFGAIYTRRLKRNNRGYGDTFFIDEVFVKINGKQHYLWRAVDQDGAAVTTRLPNVSSNGCYEAMVANRRRS
jgi:putative transposase